MEVISIERSTYEELLTSFNSFVTKMKEMASRGNDKGEIIQWQLTPGNCDDREPLKNRMFTERPF